MKKLINLLFVALCLCAIASCNIIDDTKETVYDLVNREVVLDKDNYERVVCIGAGALRLYSYIGDIDKLCAVEDIDNESLSQRPKMFDGVARPYFIRYQDVFKTLPSCGVGGPTSQAAEAEKILACNPDIIVSEYEDVTKADSLQQQLGVPVIVVSVGSKGVFDEKITRSLELLGKVFNKENRAQELNDYILENKQQLEVKTQNMTNRPNVYICGLGNWGTTNHLMTVQNFETFNVCHINNVINDLPKDGIQAITQEKLVALSDNIDIIFIDAAAIKNIKPWTDEVKALLINTKAFQNGDVYLQMAYNAYYTNVEIALINAWYNASVVYPEAFEGFDIVAKTNEVTMKFLGANLATAIFAYPNSFGGYQKIDVETFFE